MSNGKSPSADPYDRCLQHVAKREFVLAKRSRKKIDLPYQAEIAKQQIRFGMKAREHLAEGKFGKAYKRIRNLIEPARSAYVELLDGYMQAKIHDHTIDEAEERAEKLEKKRMKMLEKLEGKKPKEPVSEPSFDVLPPEDPLVLQEIEAIDAVRTRMHFNKKHPKGLNKKDRSILSVLMKHFLADASENVRVHILAEEASCNEYKVRAFMQDARQFLLRDTGWELSGDAKAGIRLVRQKTPENNIAEESP